MLRKLIILFVLLLLAGPCLHAAEKPPAVTPAQKARVAAILATLRPFNQDSSKTVEDALVKEKGVFLPVILQVLKNKAAELTKVKPERTPFDVQRLQSEIDVLDRATVRLTWKINPPQLIQQWMVKLTFPDGRKFMRESMPVRIADDRLLRVFSDRLFYFVNLPGYRGGAAPSEEVLRHYEVPEPLTPLNIFVVKKDGTVEHISGADALKAFFMKMLPPAATPPKMKDAMYAWLRLNSTLHWWNDRPLLFTISEASMLLVRDGGVSNVSGKAVLVPEDITAENPGLPANAKNSGEITGEMTFLDAKGKLLNAGITAKLNLTIDPRILVPCTPPGGGGGAEAIAPD